MHKIAVFVLSSFLILAAVAVQAADAPPDDTAKILAGMAPAANSPLEPLTKERAWQHHAATFNTAFDTLEKRQMSKIKNWSAAELKSPKPVMFYMFGGPDYLYADAFFPKAGTYVLSGLEPVGPIPDLQKLPRGQLPGVLDNLRSSLSNVINLSYFITSHMQSQLRTGPIHGTLPVLYVFLARAGKTIKEVSLVNIDKDGKLQQGDDPKSTARGAKIVFNAGGGGPQTLYYFSTDLSDGGVKNSGFLKFAAGLGQGDSFVKSASYLMHNANFSAVRDFLLNHSALILQDDTGVPLRFFNTGKWNLQPYGRYVQPIEIFTGMYQPKMAELWARGRPKPIDFGVGYRFRPNESSLLLATKIGQ